MDIYHTLCWDWLHANCAGSFSDHLWGELLKILEKMGHQTMGKAEQNINAMPHWHGLNHFKEALLISYTDGQKLEDLSKIIVFACHDILPHETEKGGYLLLHCLHAYIEFDLYMVLELHMTHTLTTGADSAYREKLGTFLKNHTHMHIFNDIEVKGVTCNFNMKPNEKTHGLLKQAYQKQTNFKDVAQQILHVNHLRLISEHIQCKIKEYDSYRMFRVAMNMDTINIAVDEPEEEYFHVKLGSQVKEPLTFKDIEKKSIADNTFN
ncbi:hypothetical protein F5J12DRAFT_784698 [Pisolithus orientalis]|uniref:uncharacterized protein n=1 Tax=Pisolithus orientalis TaxID=936130 RepID=UPI0022247FA5|nr:uncharacterized protein F5J12DRAFT_784698 [Pisolithus orientalis]KAI5999361.1 hypothetical protein F5J12DRAFT_784698 [Pisolithus orientalis]